MVRIILYAEHLVSALTIPTSAYAHVSAPHLASIITVIFNINVIIVVGDWLVYTGDVTCIIGMEKEVIRTDSITGFCFINNLSSGAPRLPSVSTPVNSRMVAVIFWWQAAVFIGKSPLAIPMPWVVCGVATRTVVAKLLFVVSAEVPALVAAAATIIFT